MPMMLQLLSVWCGRTVGAEPANGRHGFKQSQLLYVFHEHKFVPVGVMAWGGEQQRGRAYVSLNGTWCSLIDSDMWPVVRGWIESVRATLTRVDLAADFVNGEYSIEDAVDWYRAGEFNAGGRMPKHSCEGDWLHANPIGGRTLYVGKRGNGKFSRLYEKGKQLGNADSPDAIRVRARQPRSHSSSRHHHSAHRVLRGSIQGVRTHCRCSCCTHPHHEARGRDHDWSAESRCENVLRPLLPRAPSYDSRSRQAGR